MAEQPEATLDDEAMAPAANDSDSEAAHSDEPESNDEKLLEEAQARYMLAEEAESENRPLALEDKEFRAGKQWPEEIRAERERDRRPCLVINKVPQFIQQVTNDQRQNRPSIRVSPVDDAADIETAKVFQGLIRHIEYNSNADVAYDTAFDSAVTSGLGYFRVLTDYIGPESFEQEIMLKRIRNPFSVFFDPYSQEPDGSDANWAFVTDDLSAEEYRSRYPNSKLATGKDQWEATGNSKPDWVKGDSARVAEYFYKKTEVKDLVQLSDGTTMLAEALPKPLPDGVTIVKKRSAPVPVIKWCKLNGCEILEKTDWLGKWIPIVPVYGTELDINGKRILEGVIRHAKDPARMYNYWASAETEAIALAPRAPWIGAEGQFKGHEHKWETANVRNHAYLEYKLTSLNGQPAPPPQRNAFEPAVQAITQARMMAADEIKSTTGIYDASLGARSNETSGVAIQRRNQQAQTSVYHYVDNLTRSIKHAGRILVDLIPKIYDTARTARILGEDGESRIVRVNDPNFQENNKPAYFQLDAGRYDVTVDVGPSYASKRQEAAASMIEFAKTNPQSMQFIADLMVKNMDWPGAQEIAERLKKMLPPPLQDDGKGQGQDIPPQVKAQMDQAHQMVEQLTATVHKLQDEKDQKLVELESRERIEMAKIQSSVEIEMAKLGSKEGIELLRQEVAQIEQRLGALGFYEPFPQEHESQEPGMPGPVGAPPQGGMPQGGDMGMAEPSGGQPPGQPMEPPEGPMQ